MITDRTGMASLRDQVDKELTERILPFWMTNTPDDRQGGFYGRIDSKSVVVPDAPKGAVLNTRILWTFASAYRLKQDQRYLDIARRAYRYLHRFFLDPDNGGIYWLLNADGSPLDPKKQIYAQAFAIYAFSEYYRATGEKQSLALAIDLFRLVEKYSYDPGEGGYFEAYSRDWEPLDDVRLSEQDANEKKTMNTHLHILEAYTTLYRVWSDGVLKLRLDNLIELFLTTILDADTHHLKLFFDDLWNVRSNIVSYGHDIEASWLMLEAAETLENPDLRKSTKKAAVDIAGVILAEAIDTDGAIFNEWSPAEGLDADKHWWPQAEAVVGFVNAYQLTGDSAFLLAARSTWSFIVRFLLDHQYGEWFCMTDKEGTPVLEDDKVGPGKGPYHNARMCLEIIERAIAGHPNR